MNVQKFRNFVITEFAKIGIHCICLFVFLIFTLSQTCALSLSHTHINALFLTNSLSHTPSSSQTRPVSIRLCLPLPFLPFTPMLLRGRFEPCSCCSWRRSSSSRRSSRSSSRRSSRRHHLSSSSSSSSSSPCPSGEPPVASETSSS